jgi:uridine kinase
MIPVIAVCGFPGAGKTSLIRGLLTALDGAAPIHMDSYERVTSTPIAAIDRWLRDGADIDAFEFPGLEEDLQKLREGLPVQDRFARRPVSGSKYVLFETQFGRAHGKTGRHIDLQIWIDVAPDVALARNLKAFLAGFLEEDRPDRLPERLRGLQGYLDNYLATVHELLAMQQARVGGASDVRMDGRGSGPSLVEAACKEIRRRFP